MPKNQESAVEVKRVVLKIAGKEIALSVEQAKELRDILSKTFGDGKVVHKHFPLWWPYTTWTYGTNSCSSGNTAIDPHTVYLTTT